MTNTLLFTQILALGLLTSQVTAHGYVQGIVADGVFYQGYRPNFQYQTPPPQVPGWSDPANIDNGFVKDYTSSDIICHLSATPGQTYATVQAGGSVELQWTPWPVGHLGPVITYLANCNGECTNVTKTELLFNKIDEKGLIQGGYSPGKWAADELVANNNSWTLTIPSTIAPGNYVLRHEIIALQEAQYAGGAQNYPQCVNIKVTGSGTNSLQSGTKGTQLYTSQDPGILINIYQALSDYIIPGPPLLIGAGNFTQPGFSSTTSVPYPNATSTTDLYFTTNTGVSTLAATSTVSTSTSSPLTFTTSTTATTTTTTPPAGGAFFAAPTTFQTSTRPDTFTSSSTSTTFPTLEFAGYGDVTVTITISEPSVFATALINTTTPWATRTRTNYAIVNSAGFYPTSTTTYATGTLAGDRPHGTDAAIGPESLNETAAGFATGTRAGTGTGIGSTYLPTRTGIPGFVSVPIDNGFKRRSARQFNRERR